MDLNAFLHDIVDKLIEVDGLQAIVLGGSWASDTQRPDSDIDLGLYTPKFDLNALSPKSL
ncbi:MAG TPA: nucleotidyltransferase domain-containing protein [Ktedonobacteraceae bacterium]|jgi:predicted nucleotidyltransferase